MFVESVSAVDVGRLVMTDRINRKALFFILATIIIDMIGLGIIVPVAPRIIMDLTQQGYAAAAEYSGWLTFSFAAMLFLFSPVVGNLSVRFGRRPVLLFSMLAMGCEYLITGLAPTIGWLFVGRLLSGMSGTSYRAARGRATDQRSLIIARQCHPRGRPVVCYAGLSHGVSGCLSTRRWQAPRNNSLSDSPAAADIKSEQ